MARRLHVLLALCLVADAFAIPVDIRPRSYADNEVDSERRELEQAASEINRLTREADKDSKPSMIDDDDDDDDDFDDPAPSSSGGGSNIFSLLKIAGALFPGSSGGNVRVRKLIQEFLKRYQAMTMKVTRRQDVADNEIELDYDLKPPPFQQQIPPTFQRQETEEESDNTESESSNDTRESTENGNEDNDNGNDDIDNNAGEESVENNDNKSNGKQELSESNGSDDDDEPPEGDEQGGGILGLLAGLSGGEDGQSDLGSLLAAVGGIVANLSGDGIDLNALIGSALGLFVGLLSEGEENPGAVIASYLLTSLETITGGGSKNNGAFFGTFLSKLIKGTSATQTQGKDNEQPASPLWTLKMDILRAILQFGTSILGLASSSSSSASTA